MSERKFPESGRTSVKPYSMNSDINPKLWSDKQEDEKSEEVKIESKLQHWARNSGH